MDGSALDAFRPRSLFAWRVNLAGSRQPTMTVTGRGGPFLDERTGSIAAPFLIQLAFDDDNTSELTVQGL